ncbi:hypothetical protein MPSEU_001032700 [Mayamaea pseudoterrestris]|nr:hypothetical protein MPSEU_001032700 [Mayamaea pseudoterrestris]
MIEICCCIALVLVVSTRQIAGAPLYDQEFPSAETEWISLSQHESFQPAATTHDDPRVAHAQRRLSSEYSSRFADSATYYDEYSTAWRLLGMYIDCNIDADSGDRRLNGDDDGVSNAWDDDQAGASATCKRFLLWAAYVDLSYQGGGIGEYQFHDASTDEWDTSACEATKNSRCAKMDCHLPNTHFTLLGFFKNYDYDDWMEQLFKHQAFCLWSQNQYNFMDKYRDWWPQGCSSTGKKDGNGYVYIDIKPGTGGTMGLGLYTDSSCTIEYKRGRVKLSNVVQKYYGSSVNDHIDTWNEAFSTFHTCQPCKAYTLSTSRKDDIKENDPNNGYFQCDDNADYTNVNQCMKFKTHTDTDVASYKEVAAASFQGTIQSSYAADITPTFWGKWGLFIISVLIFLVGLSACVWSARPPRVLSKRSVVSTEPLI